MTQLLVPLSDLQRDSESFLNDRLDHLTSDPTYDQVLQVIGELAEIKLRAQWAIGDVLVFMRYCAQFTLKGVWRKAGDGWPSELLEYVRQEYHCALSRQEAEVGEFLCWTAYHYPDFWLLERGDEVRLWQRNAREWLDDESFETYIRNLSGDLREVLDYSSLILYYHTSSAFPWSARRQHVSWTAHAEVANIAGQKVESHLRGLERLEAKRELAPKLLEEYEERNMVTVPQLRQEKRTIAEHLRGWMWEAPPPDCLYVVDMLDGQRYAALRLPAASSPALRLAQQIVLNGAIPHMNPAWGARLSSMPLTLEGDSIRMLSGDIVVTFENIDKGCVSAALSALTARLRLIVPH